MLTGFFVAVLWIAGLDGADADGLLGSVAVLSNLQELTVHQYTLEREALQALSVQRLMQLTGLAQLTKLYLEGLGRNLQHWHLRTGTGFLDPRRINVLDLNNEVNVENSCVCMAVRIQLPNSCCHERCNLVFTSKQPG